MTKLILTITRAGMDRFTAAQLDSDIDLTIATVGLTDAHFVPAPTLTNLPGEFRRLTTVSGDQVGDNLVHMVIRDEADNAYTARGFGLFLDDGTLFAVYGQEALLFEKSPRATFLAAIDIGFPTGDVSELRFGDTNFLNPPGTTARKGVIRFATPAERAAGVAIDAAATAADLRWAVPIGLVLLWYGLAATVPAGWAICDGTAVERSDGAGQIVMPDLRGRVAVGATDAMPPSTAFGAREVELDLAPAGAHRHGFEWEGRTATAQSVVTLATTEDNGTAQGGTGKRLTSATLNDPPHDHALRIDGFTDFVDPHTHTATIDVAQPSLALHYIMKV